MSYAIVTVARWKEVHPAEGGRIKSRICPSVRAMVESMYCKGGVRESQSVAYDLGSAG